MSSAETVHGAFVSFRAKAKARCSSGEKLDQSSPARIHRAPGDLGLRQPGDLQQHLAVPHAVRAVDRARDHPEQRVREDRVQSTLLRNHRADRPQAIQADAISGWLPEHTRFQMILVFRGSALGTPAGQSR